MDSLYNFNGDFKVDLNAWEKLKSTKPTYIEGSYYPVMIWNDVDDNVLFMLHMVINSTTRDKIVDMGIDNGIYDYQISLLQRMYFDEDSDIEEVSVGYKPFGNSYSDGDIIEEMLLDNKCPLDELLTLKREEEYDLNDLSEEMNKLYEIILNIIKHWKWDFLNYHGVNKSHFFKEVTTLTFDDLTEGQIKNKLETHYVNFYPFVSEMRDNEIIKLLK